MLNGYPIHELVNLKSRYGENEDIRQKMRPFNNKSSGHSPIQRRYMSRSEFMDPDQDCAVFKMHKGTGSPRKVAPHWRLI